jgi:hypothetical protein
VPIAIKEATMTRIGVAADQVRQAHGLPAVLDAACEAFQEILTVLRAGEDDTSRWFIPFVMAATSAADGRDTILFAPSLPAARDHQLPVNGTTPGKGPGQLAMEVAVLAAVLAAGAIGADVVRTAAGDQRGVRSPGRVEQVLIFGSWAARYAGETGPAPHDVEVLLVGAPDRDAAYEAARRAEQRLGREVNVTIRAAGQWRSGSDGFTRQLRSSPLLEIPQCPREGREHPDGGNRG